MDNPEFREPKGRNTMTEQNQTPDTGDDVEGHQKRRDDALRGDAHRDDTEGHMRHREDAREDDAHRDEGKKHFRRDANDGDDSEGHLHRT
jgi:hypothetical protein